MEVYGCATSCCWKPGTWWKTAGCEWRKLTFYSTESIFGKNNSGLTETWAQLLCSEMGALDLPHGKNLLKLIVFHELIKNKEMC